MEKLKDVILADVKEVIHRDKKVTSKKAFIENPQLKKEYENRSNFSNI